LLVGLMVKRIRIAPTRIELELYDRSPIIEDWSKGERDGWFRTRLNWLPTPMFSGTTIWIGVDVDVWGFEGVFQEAWEEMVRRVVVGVLRAITLTRLCRRNLTYSVGRAGWMCFEPVVSRRQLVLQPIDVAPTCSPL